MTELPLHERNFRKLATMRARMLARGRPSSRGVHGKVLRNLYDETLRKIERAIDRLREIRGNAPIEPPPAPVDLTGIL